MSKSAKVDGPAVELGDLEPAIDRLRKQRLAVTAPTEREGFAAGVAWARETAGAVELERLAAVYDPGDRWDSACDRWQAGASPHTLSQRFAYCCDPLIAGQGGSAKRFWFGAIGERAELRDDPDFLTGFARGALAVWNAVRDKL